MPAPGRRGNAAGQAAWSAVRPSPLARRPSEFEIREPKRRWISAAPFRDRVVHHALCRVVAPVWDRTLIADSYACRVGKGTHAALDRVQEHLRAARWVWQADIARFFPSVDHGILRRAIARNVKDSDVLWLCGVILDGSPPPPSMPLEYFAADDLFTPIERRSGLPIGNLSSQWWANLYLSPLDHFVQERLGLGRYARYMDDLLIFDDDRERLRAAWREIERFLAGLRLRLHPRKTHLVPAHRGVAFLGFHVHPSYRTLLVENKVRARRRLRRLAADYARGAVDVPAVRASVAAWIGHAAHGNTWRLRGRMLREVAFRRGPAASAAPTGEVAMA